MIHSFKKHNKDVKVMLQNLTINGIKLIKLLKYIFHVFNEKKSFHK